MKRLAVLLGLLLALFGSTAQASGGMSDSFVGPALSPIYHTCYPWGCNDPTNPGIDRYAASQVHAAHGLHLVANRSGGGYVSGMVQTKGGYAFEYGTITATFTAPKGKGLWPAIWLLPANGQKYTELDGIEIVNGVANVGVHYNVNGTHHHSGGPVHTADLSRGIHTLKIAWWPHHISWIIDGVTVRRETDSTHIPHTPMYLIANLAVGGAWPGQPDATTPFPADFTLYSLSVVR